MTEKQTGTGIAGAMDYVPRGAATAAEAPVRSCYVCGKDMGERSAHSVRAVPFWAMACSKPCAADPRFASPPTWHELMDQVRELRAELARRDFTQVTGLPWLPPQDRAELQSTVSYALRYSMEGKPLAKGMKIPDPDLAAERVLEHMERSLWDVRRRPPTPPHSAG